MNNCKLTGDMIRVMRDRPGWTQAELAEKLGLAEGTLRNYEKQTRSDKEGLVVIPMTIDWALAAIDNNLRPFSETYLRKKEGK